MKVLSTKNEFFDIKACFKPFIQHCKELSIKEYMYMGSYLIEGDIVIHTYKNECTRDYINIDNEGNRYSYSYASNEAGSYKLCR